jgi:plasmid maintenance system antidote protein VapI
MGDREGQLTNPTEKLRALLRDRGWSSAELAWVLSHSAEATENLVRDLRVTPTLALRLEAAFDIPAREWFAVEAMAVPDLWLLQDQLAGELAGIRWRRYRLDHDRRQGGGGAKGLLASEPGTEGQATRLANDGQ